jgi:hypothetical protein
LFSSVCGTPSFPNKPRFQPEPERMQTSKFKHGPGFKIDIGQTPQINWLSVETKPKLATALRDQMIVMEE